MQQDILINWSPQETRVAVVENGAVQELHVERTLERGLVGNVYQGKVARVSAGHAVGLHRHRPGARGIPARGRRLAPPAGWRAAAGRTQRAGPDPDRAPGVRRPGADGAGDQGPDRQQGRAAVDADQHRRPAAGVSAAGRPCRGVAEDSAGPARRIAQPAAGADPARRRRLHSAHQWRGCAATPNWPRTLPICARPGPASSRRRMRLAAGHPCCTRT